MPLTSFPRPAMASAPLSAPVTQIRQGHVVRWEEGCDGIQAVRGRDGADGHDDVVGLLLVVRSLVWRPPFERGAGMLSASPCVLSAAMLPADWSRRAGAELEPGPLV